MKLVDVASWAGIGCLLIGLIGLAAGTGWLMARGCLVGFIVCCAAATLLQLRTR